MAWSRVTRLWSAGSRARRAVVVAIVFASVFAPMGLLGRAKAADTGLKVAGTMDFGFQGDPSNFKTVFVDKGLHRAFNARSDGSKLIAAYDLDSRRLIK